MLNQIKSIFLKFQFYLIKLFQHKVQKKPINDLFSEHEKAFKAGDHFELFDPKIGFNKKPRAMAIAYYLPQFHQMKVNDLNWGEGFTEWTNIARSGPRFKGHIQPKVPRDLGFYNLLDSTTQIKQAQIAKNAGLHGFCYYYYWLDNKPVMDSPLEKMLADKSIDFPFCLMWCNENWTRTWHGKDSSILLEQKYDNLGLISMVDHLAKFMLDERYVRISGKPLFFVYRFELIENNTFLAKMIRELFAERHNLDILFFMSEVEGGNINPMEYGLDGGAEFLPGKFKRKLTTINNRLKLYDKSFKSNVYSYDDLVNESLNLDDVDYSLIRGIMPAWDNTPRRPGNGQIFYGSTPKKFYNWADKIIDKSIENPIDKTPVVLINAWNEWAEGAVLEPDTHYGGAYLNALSRALYDARKEY